MLTPEEKARNARERMIETSRQWQIGTHAGKVATVYQKMIRAEAASRPAEITAAIVDGVLVHVFREVGQVVCVTCGKVGPWKSDKSAGENGIETGHCEGGRTAAVLFADHNANPQCVYCNRNLSGNVANYKLWIRHLYGQDEVDRLGQLRHQRKQFTHEELVDMRIEFAARLKAAERKMT